MKAITLLQPWALLMVAGPKRTETRSWNTSHRGPTFIHASQKLDEPRQIQAMQENPYIRELCEGLGFPTLESMPRGVIVGGVELVDTYRFTEHSLGEAHRDERLLGNFAPGRFGFCTEDPWMFPVHMTVPHRGYPNMWRVAAERRPALLAALDTFVEVRPPRVGMEAARPFLTELIREHSHAGYRA